MSTPSKVPGSTDVIVEDTAVTSDTAVVPPGAPAPPPPLVAEPYPDSLAAPPVAASEQVIVDDATGTRVVQRDVRPTLPPEEDPRRWNWLTPTLVAICLIALGIVLAAILLSRDDDDGTRSGSATTTVAQTNATPPANVNLQVPSLVGQSRGQAEAALERAGLVVVVAQVPGPEPTGQVLAQSPRAGATATEGDTVRINVSNGEQSAATEAPATTTPATSTPATSTPAATTPEAPTTTPASTTPAPGATAIPSSGSSGTSTSSDSNPSSPSEPAQTTSVSVPSLSGDVKAAVQQLNSKGLLASVQYVPSDEPLGTVVSQSPASGEAKTGSHVTLSVASGPGEKQQVSVPDTTGQTIPEAVETLNGANLRLIMVKKTVTDREQAGQVVEQTPAPGKQAPKNAQVLVYMGAFKG